MTGERLRAGMAGTAWQRAAWLRGRAAMRDLWIGGVLIALVVAFSLGSPYFLTRANWLNTSSTATEVLLLAVGETFVICAGGIDLSVGAVLGFAGTAGAWVMMHGFAGAHGAAVGPVALGFGCAIAAGAASACSTACWWPGPACRRSWSPWARSASRPAWATC